MIEDTLAKLEGSIKTLKGADPKKKAELKKLVAALKTELRRQSAARKASAAKIESLEDSIRGLGASHPQLVTTLDGICRELAAIGI